MNYIRSFVMVGVGIGTSIHLLLGDKGFMAHRAPSPDTLFTIAMSLVLYGALAVGPLYWTGRKRR